MAVESRDPSQRERRKDVELDVEYRTLEGVGITLIGIVITLSVTVALAIHGVWWAKVLGGVATAVAFTALVKAGHHWGGLMKRLADWLTH